MVCVWGGVHLEDDLGGNPGSSLGDGWLLERDDSFYKPGQSVDDSDSSVSAVADTT